MPTSESCLRSGRPHAPGLAPRRRRVDRHDDADAAARRHRAVARRQDHLHHRADPQPRLRRAAAVLHARGRGPHRARLPRAAARRRGAALRLRGAPRCAVARSARVAGEHAAPFSQVRITIEFKSASALRRAFGISRLNLDVVDYPGEWLIDLPLLDMSYEQWCAEAVAQAAAPRRQAHSKAWREFLSSVDPNGAEGRAGRRCAAPTSLPPISRPRAPTTTCCTRPGPGRFLLPGDLEGSPLLTFCPLALGAKPSYARSSLAAMMARRFESYKTHVVRPFFRDHFSRLDRQIVLVDVLGPLNEGGDAVVDLQRALEADPARVPRRLVQLADARCSCAASTSCCSPPPRPTTSTPRATTGWKRSCASSPIAPWAAPPTPAPRSACRRSPRCGRRARPTPRSATNGCRASSACRCRASASAARCSTARRKPPCFPATCRSTRTMP